VGTARRFRPPLYIHIRPQSRVVARHSSRRPLCSRREKRAILRATRDAELRLKWPFRCPTALRSWLWSRRGLGPWLSARGLLAHRRYGTSLTSIIPPAGGGVDLAKAPRLSPRRFYVPPGRRRRKDFAESRLALIVGSDGVWLRLPLWSPPLCRTSIPLPRPHVRRRSVSYPPGSYTSSVSPNLLTTM